MGLQPVEKTTTRGQWMALTAAMLGWMFDGFEMGLFPAISGPALQSLIGGTPSKQEIGQWNAIITASFLVGAATGGVLFGWLGDRLGRVRAMSLSILTYAICSGLGGLAIEPWHMVVIRFFAALGMGGEWSLGVALVMEVWGGRSRALLAGLIGAAANLGYMIVAVLGLGLGSLNAWFGSLGLNAEWRDWRLLMVCGALPAFLTFFIRLFVPESERWQKEQDRGATTSWASQDLLTVLFGVGVCTGLLVLIKTVPDLLWLHIVATVITVVLVAGCYLYPIFGYLSRSHETQTVRTHIIRRMLIGALISGVPLLATWGAVQWASLWANELGKEAIRAGTVTEEFANNWKFYTQLASAFGAVLGSLGGALLAGWVGRRIAYICLCGISLAAVLFFYQGNDTVDAKFYLTAFLAGGCSAAFYGWLPLYLPELFPTRVRATGQGFSFNFGRILAAVGVLQLGYLMGTPPDYPRGCSTLAFIYLAGLVVIWLAPETKGQPLPE